MTVVRCLPFSLSAQPSEFFFSALSHPSLERCPITSSCPTGATSDFSFLISRSEQLAVAIIWLEVWNRAGTSYLFRRND